MSSTPPSGGPEKTAPSATSAPRAPGRPSKPGEGQTREATEPTPGPRPPVSYLAATEEAEVLAAIFEAGTTPAPCVGIQPYHLTDLRARAALAAIQRILAKGSPVRWEAVLDDLDHAPGWPGTDGPGVYVSDLTIRHPTPQQVIHAAREIVRRWTDRETALTAERLAQAISALDQEGADRERARLAELGGGQAPAVGPEPRPARGKQPPAREVLYHLAVDAGIEVIRTPTGEPWALIPEDGITRPLRIDPRGEGLRDYLSRSYQTTEGAPPPRQALGDAVQAFASLAAGPATRVVPVHHRIAHVAGAVLVDIGDDSRRIIRIAGEGHQLEPCPPDVLFARAPHTGILPEPAPDGQSLVDLLRAVLGDALTDEGAVLLTAWAFGTWGPGPYPVAMISAPHDSGKTTAARTTRRLIDPMSGTGVSTPQREPRDLISLASNAHVVMVDNLSILSTEMSDTLSCLATGADFSARRYYTNRDLDTVSLCRPVLMTSILEIITHGDLADRSIGIALRAPTERATVGELDARARAVAPAWIGAMCEAASLALRRLPATPVPGTRMADFARWVVAACPELGFGSEDFLAVYAASKEDLATSIIESDPVASAVLDLAAGGDWTGPLHLLCDRLAAYAGDVAHGKAWPTGPQVMAGALKRLAPLLRAHHGVQVEHRRVRLGGGRHPTHLWAVGRVPESPAKVCPISPDLCAGQPAQGRHRDGTETAQGTGSVPAVPAVPGSPSVNTLADDPDDHNGDTGSNTEQREVGLERERRNSRPEKPAQPAQAPSEPPPPPSPKRVRGVL